MNKYINRTVIASLHIGLGAAAVYSSVFGMAWTVIFLSYILFELAKNRNKDNIASYGIVYMVALELVLRSTESHLVYEIGKFAVIGIGIFALFIERNDRPFPKSALIYFIILLPSLVMIEGLPLNEARKAVSFNLSGPLCLSISWLYFYKRKISKAQLSQLIFMAVIPLISLISVILIKMPSFSEIKFTGESNEFTSGGFGPNQMSSILGYGFAILSISLLLKLRIFLNRTLDIACAMMFLSFGFLTFSRGGIIIGIIAFISSLGVYSFKSGNAQTFVRNVALLIGMTLVVGILWNQLDDLTGNMLSQRYEKSLGRDDVSIKNKKEGQLDFAGRGDLISSELEFFIKYPILGAGPGMIPLLRYKQSGNYLAAHTEFTRLLADHGSYGLMALLILLFSPIKKFRNANTMEKVVSIALLIISLGTMFHAAMRLALPGVIYGLSYINLDLEEHSLQKKAA